VGGGGVLARGTHACQQALGSVFILLIIKNIKNKSWLGVVR